MSQASAVEELQKSAAAATTKHSSDTRPKSYMIVNGTLQPRPAGKVKNHGRKYTGHYSQKGSVNGRNHQAGASLAMNGGPSGQPSLSVSTDNNVGPVVVGQGKSSPPQSRGVENDKADGKNASLPPNKSNFNRTDLKQHTVVRSNIAVTCPGQHHVPAMVGVQPA